jgi:tetratricopeptide (TPR) repeat protein
MALPHTELAALDYLFVSGEPASVYAARALSLAGNDTGLVSFVAEVALQAGDHPLAARSWRRMLEVKPSSWPQVADAAVTVLSPDEILGNVVLDGRSAVLFAGRLYASDQDRPVRARFYQNALERKFTDENLTDAESLFLQASALAGLDQSDQARERVDAALALDPYQLAWREEYINWLVRWGRLGDAHTQALNGLYFFPESSNIRAALERTAEELARLGRDQ